MSEQSKMIDIYGFLSNGKNAEEPGGSLHFHSFIARNSQGIWSLNALRTFHNP